MYQAYWGLRDAVFRNSLDVRRFIRTAAHNEALARMHFLVEGRWRLGMVLGPAGVGKSLLLEVFASELRREAAQVARIDLRGLEPTEALWELAAGLGLDPALEAGSICIWRQIADRLIENRYQRIGTVVLLDNLDHASREVQEQILRLLCSDRSPEGSLSIIAVADRARTATFGRLLPLVDLRIELEPWSLEESEQYITATLAQHKCQRRIFSAQAIARLHELSGGIPRRLNQLAELALVAAFGSELPQVDAQTVETVDSELGSPVAV
jgi:type II secretory pathway predicted ATPase ExeA